MAAYVAYVGRDVASGTQLVWKALHNAIAACLRPLVLAPGQKDDARRGLEARTSTSRRGPTPSKSSQMGGIGTRNKTLQSSYYVSGSAASCRSKRILSAFARASCFFRAYTFAWDKDAPSSVKRASKDDTRSLRPLRVMVSSGAMEGFDDRPNAGGRFDGFNSFLSSFRGDWRGSTPFPNTGDGKDSTGRGARTLSKGFFFRGGGFFFRSSLDPSWGDQAMARPWPGAGDQAMARQALLSTAEERRAAADGGA